MSIKLDFIERSYKIRKKIAYKRICTSFANAKLYAMFKHKKYTIYKKKKYYTPPKIVDKLKNWL